MEDRKKGIITVADVTELIEDAVPVSLQESWDNSGLLIGFPEKHVKKVITCLEITEAVADEAVAAGADMIVSHHPLIFSGIRKLSYDSSEDRAVMKLVSNGISVYSCHTPFDKVRGGNNDIIAERLGLSSVKNLRGDDVVSRSKMAENRDEADIKRARQIQEAFDLYAGYRACCEPAEHEYQAASRMRRSEYGDNIGRDMHRSRSGYG